MRTMDGRSALYTLRQLQEGVTLLELLVVLIVLTLALAAGIPLYTKTVQGAQAQTAIQGLRAIRAREEARRSITGRYYNGGGLVGTGAINPAPAGTSLSLNLPGCCSNSTSYYNYTLNGNGVTFTATASRMTIIQIPNGPVAIMPAGDTITLNQAGTWGGNSLFVPNAQE